MECTAWEFRAGNDTDHHREVRPGEIPPPEFYWDQVSNQSMGMNSTEFIAGWR